MFTSAPSASEEKSSVISRAENPAGSATPRKKWPKPLNETGKNIAVSSKGQSPVSIRSHHGASLRIEHIARNGYNCQGKSAHPTSNLASMLKTKKGDVHCAFSRQSSLSFSPYSYSLRLHTPRKSSSTAAISLRMLQSDFCKRLRSAPSKAAPLARTPSISTSTVRNSPPPCMVVVRLLLSPSTATPP